VGERNIFLVTCHPALATSFMIQSDAVRERLQAIYTRLYAHFGPQHWWPGESRWEVMVGAILTQNTSWLNVEKALVNLKHAGRLEPEQMRRTRQATLARLIRPSGYFNLKAKKLKALVEFLFERFDGNPARLAGRKLSTQRAELLEVYGIGPETADSILLYAADQPIFVMDAYSRRIGARLGLTREDASYDELQQLFMEHLPAEAPYFNEYHALLVALGKRICTKRDPRCGQCPLNDLCPKIGVELIPLPPTRRGRRGEGEGKRLLRRGRREGDGSR
jgi:endonuclease-3 related protein